MKNCTKCHELKSLEAFSRNRTVSDGLNGWCKPCVSVDRARHYAANRDRLLADITAYARVHRAANPLWATWQAMKGRCLNPTATGYARYGGRGIHVHADWLKFVPFRDYIEANLGPRPAGHSMDRIDNDGSYEPGNVRWASAKEQAGNRRPARPVPAAA